MTFRRQQSLEIWRRAAELAAAPARPRHRSKGSGGHRSRPQLGQDTLLPRLLRILPLGQLVLRVLEKRELTYSERFSLRVPLFDGSTVQINWPSYT